MDNKFRYGNLSDEEEHYLDGYPSLTNDFTIEDPEFVFYLTGYEDKKFGAYSIQDLSDNDIIEILVIKLNLCLKGEEKFYSEEHNLELIVEDQVYPNTYKVKYYLYN